MNYRARLIVATAAASILACDGGGTTTSATSLELVGPDGGHSLNVVVGAQVLLTARVKDAAGVIVTSPAPVTFMSRNASRAEVDNAGRVAVRAAGAVYVVATLDAMKDSVLVNGFQ